MKHHSFRGRLTAFAVALSMLLMPMPPAPAVLTVAAEEGAYTEGIYQEQLQYVAYDDHVAITGMTDTSIQELTIPDTIDGLPVTEISGYACRYCTNLTAVTLPATLTTIGSHAFQDSRSLTSVTLPAGLTELGDAAFAECTSLSEFRVEPGNTAFLAKDGILYDSTGTQLLRYPPAKSGTEFTIPDDVTDVGDAAFQECSNLVSVTMPDTVENTGKGVFAGCSALEHVQLSDRLTELGYYNQSWGGYFASCGKLRDINLPSALRSIGSSCFLYCSALEEITLPDSVTEIGRDAFTSAENLTTVRLSASLRDLSGNVFTGCKKLEEIIVPESCRSFSVRDGILYDAQGTTLICYPAGRTEKTVTVPEGTVEIGASAFQYARSLEKVILPESLRDIGDSAFEDAVSLADVEFTSDSFLTSGTLGFYAFRATAYAGALRDGNGFSITPEGILLETPDDQAKLVIPETVRMAASDAFSSDTIETVEFMGSVNLCPSAFSYCSSLQSVTIHGDCNLHKHAFDSWRTSLTDVQVDGILTGSGSLPSSVVRVSHSRQPLQYRYGALGADAQYAKTRCVWMGEDAIRSGSFTSYPGVNNGFTRDALQELRASDGSVYAVYLGSGYVYLIPEREDLAPVRIENEGYTCGAAAFDEHDRLYLFWAYRISDDDIEESLKNEEENLCAVQYDLSGNVLGSCGIPISTSRAQFPYAAGNANMLVKDGILGCLFNTEWTRSGDGYHHQGAEFAAIRTEGMSLTHFSTWEGSHSFGVTMIPTDFGFAAVQMGDATGRGINLNTYGTAGGVFDNNYLFSNGYHVLYHSSGQYGSNAAQLDGNTTYTHLGGFAKSVSTYAVAGKSNRVYTSDVYYDSPLRSDIYDVFVHVMDSTFLPVDDLAGETRTDVATGEIADTNVIWLTANNETEAAGNVKLVTLEDGSYCVLWEHFTDRKPDGVRYVILDECGNVLRGETAVPNAQLSNTSIQPIVRGDTLTWAVSDGSDGVLIWYTLDLNDTAGAPEVSYAAAEALAAEKGLPFALREGDFGTCGESVCWVYLEDSRTLLVAGEGRIRFGGECPWSAFAEKAETVYVGDGIDNLPNYAFSGFTALQSAQLPAGIRSLGDGLFNNCPALTTVSPLPEELTVIPGFLFYGCSSLTDVQIPPHVTSIGDYAFYGCKQLGALTIPESVTSIGSFAFQDCKLLPELRIPAGMTMINPYTFYGCRELAKVRIPKTIQKIGEAAFAECPDLTEFIVEDPYTELSESVFRYYDSAVPEGLTIYGYAGSTAEAFAKAQEIPFALLEEPEESALLTVSVTDDEGNAVTGMQMRLFVPEEETVITSWTTGSDPRRLGMLTPDVLYAIGTEAPADGYFGTQVQYFRFAADGSLSAGTSPDALTVQETAALTLTAKPVSLHVTPVCAGTPCDTRIELQYEDAYGDTVTEDAYVLGDHMLLPLKSLMADRVYRVVYTPLDAGGEPLPEMEGIAEFCADSADGVIYQLTQSDTGEQERTPVKGGVIYLAIPELPGSSEPPLPERTLPVDGALRLTEAEGAVLTADDPAIAAADESGTLHALTPGTTGVTLTLPDGETLRYQITVIADVMRGDVNLDGKVTAEDAAQILIYAAAMGAGEPGVLNPEAEAIAMQAADTNGDGMVNAEDAANVLLFAAAQGADGNADWSTILGTP